MANDQGPHQPPQLTWLNIIATMALLVTVAGSTWTIFQAQLSNLQEQSRQADASIAAEIRELRDNQEKNKDETVSRREHDENVKRIDGELTVMRDRLNILETTRPTTGELQTTADSVKSQINEVKDRLRFLEQAPRPTRIQEPPPH